MYRKRSKPATEASRGEEDVPTYFWCRAAAHPPPRCRADRREGAPLLARLPACPGARLKLERLERSVGLVVYSMRSTVPGAMRFAGEARPSPSPLRFGGSCNETACVARYSQLDWTRRPLACGPRDLRVPPEGLEPPTRGLGIRRQVYSAELRDPSLELQPSSGTNL